jgi:HAD superfamily hydrolase (TIGR01509 family)
MLQSGMKFDAVLFDCDGVLVDSEHITNQVLRDMLDERGWRMNLQECMDVFLGKTVMDERVRIEQHTGQALTPDWMDAFRARRNAMLETHLEAIPNIGNAVRDVHALAQGRIACASGADRFKVELMLRKVGLHQYLDGRIFSGQEMPRNKPHPDVYLAAAKGLGVAAQRCAVVEDTLTGLAAGVAAGATVYAYVPSGSGQRFIDAGAHCVFTDMAHLPALLV